MKFQIHHTLVVIASAVVGLMVLTACGGSESTSVSDGELVGLFRLTPGAVSTGSSAQKAVTGTYFRMIQPGGTADNGPFMINANSPADGGQTTLLSPGTAGGLRTGGYQSQPQPAFAADGGSLADAIATPTKFFAVEFSISTNPVDLQTKTAVAPPTVELHDGKLTADVSSWTASWNRQNFNQGAPKPVSSTGAQAPGEKQVARAWDWAAGKWLDAAPKPNVGGSGATGIFDSSSRHFTLDWTSLIVGGPFNGFTGKWHLEGTFEPSDRAPSSASTNP